MVVQSTERIRNVQAMVTRMESPVHKRVGVHDAMDRVLPCVDEEGCKRVLKRGDDDPVEGLGEEDVDR